MSRGRIRGQHLLTSVSIFGLISCLSLPAAAQQVQTLDTITVSPIGRTAQPQRGPAAPSAAPDTTARQNEPFQQSAIDTLAPVSIITQDTIQTISAKRLSDIFYSVPGVTFQERGDNPETSINIRGLQDFGRVAVVIDGARQNYQRTGHNANGGFFLDPELIGGVDIVRGPSANIYGSGAIGGVVSFRTKDADDILKPGERFATAFAGMAGSNAGRGMGSVFTAGKPNANVDYILGGTYRTQKDYKGGDEITIANTSNHVGTSLAKLTVRPMDGHEFKFGGLFQEDTYNIGQYRRFPGNDGQGTSVYATDVKNYQANARWKYYKPEDRLFNWDANVYWNRTENDQTKIAHNAASLGNAISGFIGDPRGYKLDTVGFDANNTSRFETGAFRHALTIGGDAFKDDVSTFDSRGNSNVTTPGGQRTVAGAFAQLKSNYSTWLEIVSAIRYDNYSLESQTNSASGDRFSPKITVGVTPIQGFTPYVSYAEGYRAPSITETLIAGAHVSATPQSAFFACPGQAGLHLFCFLPNPNLRPEVGKTKEAGLNLKYDNIFSRGDSFRGKINVFRNDLEDYIELAQFGPFIVAQGVRNYQFFQYQNIDKAHIQGFEAETMYDAGGWFVGVSATLQRGYNDVTNQGLINIQGDRIVTTGGVRLLERKLTLAASWVSSASNQHVPQPQYIPSTSYDLLKFYLTYEPVKDLWVNFTVDNALNKYYRPYAIPRGGDGGGTQNDVLWASVPPGIVYKGSVRMRFSAM